MLSLSRRLLSTLGFLCCGVLVSYVPACGDGDSHTDDEATSSGVVFEGDANDEALAKLEASKPTTDVAKGPTFTSPSPDTKLPPTPLPTFAWKASVSAAVERPAKRAFAWSERVRPPAPLARFPFGAERAAAAHGAPLNGRAYLVAFSAAGNEPVLRVFTSATTYAPDAAAWAKLRGATGTITATITTASYDVNNLVQDTPIVTGPPLTFTVLP